ncbi:hypothetical protein HDC90_000271 [Pedobacter sp. AK013]|nr:hypothetical protein [Pedobacter sp. AK013]
MNSNDTYLTDYKQPAYNILSQHKIGSKIF